MSGIVTWLMVPIAVSFFSYKPGLGQIPGPKSGRWERLAQEKKKK